MLRQLAIESSRNWMTNGGAVVVNGGGEVDVVDAGGGGGGGCGCGCGCGGCDGDGGEEEEDEDEEEDAVDGVRMLLALAADCGGGGIGAAFGCFD
ncbi:hypothetical protein ACMBCN_02095 [Candidatus Liberibacter asiaticus]|nr:hypothetical protein [Candidatus Liberibacter asiaticus]